MDHNLAIFLVMAVAIGAAVVLTALTAWIRSGRRDAGGQAGLEENRGGVAGKAALLARENDQLKAHVGQLEERLRVLERIATDPAERTRREIDSLS